MSAELTHRRTDSVSPTCAVRKDGASRARLPNSMNSRSCSRAWCESRTRVGESMFAEGRRSSPIGENGCNIRLPKTAGPSTLPFACRRSRWRRCIGIELELPALGCQLCKLGVDIHCSQEAAELVLGLPRRVRLGLREIKSAHSLEHVEVTAKSQGAKS